MRFAETLVKRFLCDMQRWRMHIAAMEKHDRLRQARIKAGFDSAADAARRLGMAYGTYSGHENGSRGMRDDDLERYAKVFKVTPEWLAFGAGDIRDDPIPVIGQLKDGGIIVRGPWENTSAETGLTISEQYVSVKGFHPDFCDALIVTADDLGPLSDTLRLALIYRTSIPAQNWSMPGHRIVQTASDEMFYAETLISPTKNRYHLSFDSKIIRRDVDIVFQSGIAAMFSSYRVSDKLQNLRAMNKALYGDEDVFWVPQTDGK